MADNEQLRLVIDSDFAKQYYRQSAAPTGATQPLSVAVIEDETIQKRPPETPKTKPIAIGTAKEQLRLCGLLGHVVGDKRKTAGLSRKQLAQMTGINVNWLKQLENGYLQVNRVNQIALERIAAALEMPFIALEILCQVDNDSLADDIDILEKE